MDVDLTIYQWQGKVHKLAVEKGFYEGDDFNLDQKLLLIISEIVEAQDALRSGHTPVEVYYGAGGGKPDGFGIELADAMIRIMDLAEHLQIDLEQMIALKHAYNETRPHKHGKAF